VRDTKNLVGEICAALVRDPDDVALQRSGEVHLSLLALSAANTAEPAL
jgi:predicted RNA-binding protein YlqC (UPF0109 family)